ncbi:MAG: sulfite reductase, ferredoxin dependent [Cyanobacteriota bacterium]|nr:sulfite reductase, ferredoxin dependent [Cyanobacteriota bacterium]
MVDTLTGIPAPVSAKLAKNEAIKTASNFLREPLATELRQDTSHFSEPAVQILKFHGTYQQDNRDARQERRQAGLERDYSMMLRTRVPGGHVPAPLYLTLDQLSETYGNGTLRTTTRQTFQIHGILKQNLKTVIGSIIQQMGSTLATCGDVNRNIMAPAAPYQQRPDYRYAQEYAHKLADVLAPHTRAYYELWVDDQPIEIPEDPEVSQAKQFVGQGVQVVGSPEPLYGNQYLPRKFKAAITVAGDNSVDIYSQDIGLVVLTTPTGKLKGFNILVGGGLGRTHGKEETFPLLAQPLGFATPAEIYEVVQAIVAVQRDHGNRQDRRQARMKYLVHQWGIRKFRRAVEQYYGSKLKRFRVMPEFVAKPELGWREQGDGQLFLGLSIENGRIQDTPNCQLKTALREIAQHFALPLRLTPTQDILLTDINPAHREKINQILVDRGVLPVERIPPLVQVSMACPALPTCGLAITESERALPDVLRRLHGLLGELDLAHEPLVVRMTGCPNGCARPYLAELGLVGVTPEHYQIWLGGSPRGERLASVFLEKLHVDQITTMLRPILFCFQQERYAQESLGDYCHRVGLERLRPLITLE